MLVKTIHTDGHVVEILNPNPGRYLVKVTGPNVEDIRADMIPTHSMATRLANLISIGIEARAAR